MYLQKYYTQHFIEVDCNVATAYEICRNAANWPNLFPPCNKVHILENKNNTQIIEIEAYANGNLVKWQSKRWLYPDEYKIFFKHLKPLPFLNYMIGEWRFYPLRSSTLITLEHRFSIKHDIEDAFPNIETPQQAYDYIMQTLNHNSLQELKSIKTILENQTESSNDLFSMRFDNKITIPLPIECVYKKLWNVQQWPMLLNHCLAVDLHYDDGIFQEFTMLVDVKGNKEKIRSIRQGHINYQIDYFQPKPPEVLKYHRGYWILQKDEQGTIVQSVHDITLSEAGVKNIWGSIPIETALNKVKNAIEANSLATLNAIKNC